MSQTSGVGVQMAFFFFNDNVQRKSTAAELCVEQVW